MLVSSANLVIPVVYDGFSRQVNKYLPYATGSTDGLYKEGALTSQQSFYSSVGSPLATQGENYFYAHTEYEPSPLNRVIKTMAAGNS